MGVPEAPQGFFQVFTPTSQDECDGPAAPLPQLPPPLPSIQIGQKLLSTLPGIPGLRDQGPLE